MSYRCIDAFQFIDRTYPGGVEVDDNDPILQTHRANFVQVNRPAFVKATETATATPGEPRAAEPAKKLAPAKKVAGKKAPQAESPADETPAPVAPFPEED